MDTTKYVSHGKYGQDIGRKGKLEKGKRERVEEKGEK
jgi:hypothetical protein